MGIIAWIIVGGLAGWIASKIMKRDAQMGIIANIICGVLGGILANLVVEFAFGIKVMNPDGITGWIVALIAAIIGACIVIAIWAAITNRRKGHARV